MSPVVETLAELVRRNSVNPEWSGPGEAAVAAFVREFFARREIETRVEEVLPGRPNVIARLPGRDRQRCVVLEAHLDTVSADDMTIPPFEPAVRDGRLHGRGSCDTKAGLAAMMHALASLKERGEVPPVDVVLAAVIDEEHAFRGVTRFLESTGGGPQPEAAVVAEPTELRLVRANKGALRWRITTHGKAAHSSKPRLGRNAITAMARVIQVLEADTASLGANAHPLVGAPTCSIGLIHGGAQVNFVPERCTITLDRRLIPGERLAEVTAHYEKLLDTVRPNLPGIRVEMEPPYLADEAMETPAGATVVQTARAVLAAMGLPGEPAGVPFGCDASKFSRAGIPAIIFGPGSIDQAHGAVEYVELRQVELAFDFHRRFLLAFGQP